MNEQARSFVAGHRGVPGSALVRRLAADGYWSVITRTRSELHLTDQAAVNPFIESEWIAVVPLLSRGVSPACFVRGRETGEGKGGVSRCATFNG
ncbi:NAD-dependent epimerase/dehydratase family protein [Paraburkholderia panacisoli]|uniref:NAD-dependent epimerase/dehydratase family protein n=1 Tax=Paraburkholderia panacisoli TaxID=2603818 RepID=A0A5B0GL27_9BURK|nr:NAD-dependent epimerase/dehydratase family protein [Paraburkholderia panacisoli]